MRTPLCPSVRLCTPRPRWPRSLPGAGPALAPSGEACHNAAADDALPSPRVPVWRAQPALEGRGSRTFPLRPQPPAPTLLGMVTAAQLAADLGVGEAEVLVVLDDYASPPSPEAIPDCITADVRLILDPTTAVMHVLPRGRRVIR